MNEICHSEVEFTVMFYPKELRDDVHLDRYVCSINCSNLEKAKEVAQLYHDRGFNVAIWEEKTVWTRVEIMEASE